MSHPQRANVDSRVPRPSLGFVVLALLGTGVLAVATGRALALDDGTLGIPLDDAFIHFQYARRFAEFRPFDYSLGDPPAAGTTSLLWPLLLAPFWALGWRELALAAPALGLSLVALLFLVFELRRLALGLVPVELAETVGLGALCFSPFIWFAGSGMEVVPFAWLLTRGIRVHAEYLEGSAHTPTERAVLLHAALGALARPEGVLLCLTGALALGARARGLARLRGMSALACALLPNVIYLLGTGSAVATTATAKWLPLNPYRSSGWLDQDVPHHAQIFFLTLLDGEEWSWLFLPSGARWVAWAALLALGGKLMADLMAKRRARAGFVLLLALAVLIPTSYETFLVNRLRYLWPFAPAWLVGLAVLVATPLEHWRHGRTKLARIASVALLAAGFLAFGLKLPRVLQDLTESSEAIAGQHVELARWAKDELSAETRIGVNDTGALAYLSEHRTFDVVGLTTRGEAEAWVAGPGSRFEHYERLGAERLPDVFIVYPEWFQIPELLGERLTSRYVDATILGGHEKTAFRADYTALDSGSLPQRAHGPLVDELDVADLESEALHGYQLGVASRDENRVFSHAGVTDGGRAGRREEVFQLDVAPGGQLVLRLVSRGPGNLWVDVGGSVTELVLDDGWQEPSAPVPERLSGRQTLRIRFSGADVAFLHAWSHQAETRVVPPHTGGTPGPDAAPAPP